MPDQGVAVDQQPAPQWHFFISYTALNRDWAEWIAWQLEAAGYRVLIQAWDFVPGAHWMSRMTDGVRGSERVLVVLSHAYLESVYGRAEWESAFQQDPGGFTRKVIPIRVEDCPRPVLLDRVVSFDLFDVPSDQAKDRLLAKIFAALEGREKPATEPLFPGSIIGPVSAAVHSTEDLPPIFPGEEPEETLRQMRDLAVPDNNADESRSSSLDPAVEGRLEDAQQAPYSGPVNARKNAEYTFFLGVVFGSLVGYYVDLFAGDVGFLGTLVGAVVGFILGAVAYYHSFLGGPFLGTALGVILGDYIDRAVAGHSLLFLVFGAVAGSIFGVVAYYRSRFCGPFLGAALGSITGCHLAMVVIDESLPGLVCGCLVGVRVGFAVFGHPRLTRPFLGAPLGSIACYYIADASIGGHYFYFMAAGAAVGALLGIAASSNSRLSGPFLGTAFGVMVGHHLFGEPLAMAIGATTGTIFGVRGAVRVMLGVHAESSDPNGGDGGSAPVRK